MKKVFISILAVLVVAGSVILFTKSKSSAQDSSLLQKNVELLADTESPLGECRDYCEERTNWFCEVTFSTGNIKICFGYDVKH